jgi:hypothetical protein
MTTDEAIALIPPGWRLRLAKDETGSGWSAELYHPGVGWVSNEGDSPAEVVRLAAEEARRI